MLAFFHHLPILNDDNAAGIDNRRKPVSDDESRAVFEQARQGVLDHPFGLGVHTGSGFVQDKNARVGQQGAGKRNQLALAEG